MCQPFHNVDLLYALRSWQAGSQHESVSEECGDTSSSVGHDKARKMSANKLFTLASPVLPENHVVSVLRKRLDFVQKCFPLHRSGCALDVFSVQLVQGKSIKVMSTTSKQKGMF